MPKEIYYTVSDELKEKGNGHLLLFLVTVTTII